MSVRTTKSTCDSLNCLHNWVPGHVG